MCLLIKLYHYITFMYNCQLFNYICCSLKSIYNNGLALVKMAAIRKSTSDAMRETGSLLELHIDLV